jgi:hypothetical protein
MSNSLERGGEKRRCGAGSFIVVMLVPFISLLYTARPAIWLHGKREEGMAARMKKKKFFGLGDFFAFAITNLP